MARIVRSDPARNPIRNPRALPMSPNLSLHGMRGLAILIVFVYHLHRAVVTGGFHWQLPREGRVFDALELGRLGVELFFMISGFLITASLCRHRDAQRFLLNRAKRIYPAFLVPHLLIFGLGPVVGYSWLAHVGPLEYVLHFVSNLLFLPGVFNLPIAQIVAWSLSYELAFYLCAAAAYACARRSGSWWWRAPAWALWLGITGWLLVTRPRGWFFVAGVAVYFARGWLERVLARGVPGWLGLAAVAAMFAVYDALFVPAVMLATVAFATVACQQGWLAVVLRSRLLGYLGTVSYSFYLWHPVVLYPVKRLFAHEGSLLANDWLNLGLFCLVTTVLSVGVSHASYSLVEKRLTDRLFGRPGRAKQSAQIARDGVLPLTGTLGASTACANPEETGARGAGDAAAASGGGTQSRRRRVA